MGLVARKPFFRVSDQVRAAHANESARESTKNAETLHVKSLAKILTKERIEKDADQTAWTRMLVCTFAVRMQQRRGFSRRCSILGKLLKLWHLSHIRKLTI